MTDSTLASTIRKAAERMALAAEALEASSIELSAATERFAGGSKQAAAVLDAKPTQQRPGEGTLAEWFSVLEPDQLRTVWVAAITDCLLEKHGYAIPEINAALLVVRMRLCPADSDAGRALPAINGRKRHAEPAAEVEIKTVHRVPASERLKLIEAEIRCHALPVFLADMKNIDNTSIAAQQLVGRGWTLDRAQRDGGRRAWWRVIAAPSEVPALASAP